MIDPLSDAAFSDLTEVDPSEEDKKLRVRFYLDEIKDEEASKREARPIYKSVEMCEIRVPGDKDTIVVHRIKEGMQNDPRERFPATYFRWKKKGDLAQVVGTPLRRWGLMEPTEAKAYEDLGVVTVEQLAGMSDQTCQQYRGSFADRQKAIDFLAMAKGQAPLAEARAEIESLKSQVQALRDQVSGDVEEPKRRGRKGLGE